ncbi:hypothetical protein [Staphylococcus warneri]|uniref:hypothetical protein n=1 Tax=Staphylococcus warneri TaxID=1292 RepID=UPI001643E706|nr:hypothetical protein [Staphylococcus warneri]
MIEVKDKYFLIGMLFRFGIGMLSVGLCKLGIVKDVGGVCIGIVIGILYGHLKGYREE